MRPIGVHRAGSRGARGRERDRKCNLFGVQPVEMQSAISLGLGLGLEHFFELRVRVRVRVRVRAGTLRLGLVS